MILQLISLTLPVIVLGCSSYATQRDSEIITDPTFTFTISPPVRWTYYPRVTATTGTTVANYFPGQSSTSSDASQAAQNEIEAAYLEALSSSLLPTQGATTTVTYSPDQISNCYTAQAIPAGTVIGYLAGGAITQTALVSGTSGAGVTVTSCPIATSGTATTGVGEYTDYIKTVSFATRGGISQSRYNWERVTAELQSILNTRYNALFRSRITIN